MDWSPHWESYSRLTGVEIPGFYVNQRFIILFTRLHRSKLRSTTNSCWSFSQFSRWNTSRCLLYALVHSTYSHLPSTQLICWLTSPNAPQWRACRLWGRAPLSYSVCFIYHQFSDFYGCQKNQPVMLHTALADWVSFYNGERVCLLRSTNRIFEYKWD